MAKPPKSPMDIANMLAKVAHNKAQRNTAKNYPAEMDNSDPDHFEDSKPSTQAVGGNRKGPKQVAAMKEQAAGKGKMPMKKGSY